MTGQYGPGRNPPPTFSGTSWRGLEEAITDVRRAENPKIRIKEFAKIERKQECVLCKRPRHNLDACPEFLSAGILRRERLVEMAKACSVCLSSEHESYFCTNNRLCNFHGCKMRHHPLLHRLAYEVGRRLEENYQAHREAQLRHIEWRCHICEGQGHYTEECAGWPIYRCNRQDFALKFGLCPKCLLREHRFNYCPAAECVCGINGCPESHHPLLHPIIPERVTSPNDPHFEDRAEVRIDNGTRVHEDITDQEVQRVLEEPYMGTEYFVTQGRSISITRTRGRSQGVIMSPNTFLVLFNAYREQIRNQNEAPQAPEQQEESDDSSEEDKKPDPDRTVCERKPRGGGPPRRGPPRGGPRGGGPYRGSVVRHYN